MIMVAMSVWEIVVDNEVGLAAGRLFHVVCP